MLREVQRSTLDVEQAHGSFVVIHKYHRLYMVAQLSQRSFLHQDRHSLTVPMDDWRPSPPPPRTRRISPPQARRHPQPMTLLLRARGRRATSRSSSLTTRTQRAARTSGPCAEGRLTNMTRTSCPKAWRKPGKRLRRSGPNGRRMALTAEGFFYTDVRGGACAAEDKGTAADCAIAFAEKGAPVIWLSSYNLYKMASLILQEYGEATANKVALECDDLASYQEPAEWAQPAQGLPPNSPAAVRVATIRALTPRKWAA